MCSVCSVWCSVCMDVVNIIERFILDFSFTLRSCLYQIDSIRWESMLPFGCVCVSVQYEIHVSHNTYRICVNTGHI